MFPTSIFLSSLNVGCEDSPNPHKVDAEEYGNLASVERDHWYYRGKRSFVAHWLKRTIDNQAPDGRKLLDCGAGTGYFATSVLPDWEVFAQDSEDEAIELLHRRLDAGHISQSQAEALPYPDGKFDAVTALDVLEHVPEDAGAAAEIARVLRPGGVAVITVPAMMSLWSDWDVALHHCRRYDRKQLIRLFPSETWELVHVNYTNTLALPLVWLARKIRRSNGQSRLEDKIPPKWLNQILYWQFVALAKQTLLRFPCGVSLLLVARKRPDAERSEQ